MTCYQFGSSFGEENILFVAGYPKSGTTWVENFISNIPGYNPRELNGDPEIIRLQNLPDDAFKWFPKSGYSSIKTHTNPNENNFAILKKANVQKILIMYRDPRDIVVSNYFHILKNNPWKKTDNFYLDYTKVTKLEGLTHQLKMVIDTFPAWIDGWFDLANRSTEIDFYFLSYEELRNDEKRVFDNIIKFFGLRLTKIEKQNILQKISKSSKNFDPKAGPPGHRSTFRKVEICSWKSEFDEKIKLIANEKLEKTLLKLGYMV